VATGLKKQGANDGAALAFMIATPESGVDSIAISYAMLDPVMTRVSKSSHFGSIILFRFWTCLQKNRKTKPFFHIF